MALTSSNPKIGSRSSITTEPYGASSHSISRLHSRSIDRVKAMAPQHPEWKDNPLFTAALNNDLKTVAAGGLKGLLELATVTHAGMTTDEFAKIVADWIASARHPKFNRLYTDIIYQPMLELLAYLRANGFKTVIVSGGEWNLCASGWSGSMGFHPNN